MQLSACSPAQRPRGVLQEARGRSWAQLTAIKGVTYIYIGQGACSLVQSVVQAVRHLRKACLWDPAATWSNDPPPIWLSCTRAEHSLSSATPLCKLLVCKHWTLGKLHWVQGNDTWSPRWALRNMGNLTINTATQALLHGRVAAHHHPFSLYWSHSSSPISLNIASPSFKKVLSVHKTWPETGKLLSILCIGGSHKTNPAFKLCKTL